MHWNRPGSLTASQGVAGLLHRDKPRNVAMGVTYTFPQLYVIWAGSHRSPLSEELHADPQQLRGLAFGQQCLRGQINTAA